MTFNTMTHENDRIMIRKNQSTYLQNKIARRLKLLQPICQKSKRLFNTKTDHGLASSYHKSSIPSEPLSDGTDSRKGMMRRQGCVGARLPRRTASTFSKLIFFPRSMARSLIYRAASSALRIIILKSARKRWLVSKYAKWRLFSCISVMSCCAHIRSRISMTSRNACLISVELEVD